MAKKGSSQGSIALIVIVIVVIAIAAIPKEAWVALLMLVVGFFILRAFTGQKKDADNKNARWVPSDETAAQVPVQAAPYPVQAQTGKVIDSKPRFSESDILAVQQRAETVLQEFNESFNLATQSKNRLRRECQLRIAREGLIELKKLANKFPFLHLTNLQAVEDRIIAVEAETSLLPYGELVDTSKPAVLASNCSVPTSYKIPSPTDNEVPNIRWVPAGESVVVAGFTLPQGMIYFGSGSRSESGHIGQAFVVNPELPVAAYHVDEELRLTDYGPSYGNIGREARRAYLQWLAGGRCNPQANIGYVFLFFYGLERRVLLDTKYDEKVRAEIPSILAEIKRLLEVYGESSGSFRS